MTHTQVPGITTQGPHILTQRDNERAVDLIESAERSVPYCACGSHMVAVAHDSHIWLECLNQTQPKNGLSGFYARITSFTHTRRMIMELPSA
jgi:hypothetical protein